MSYVCLGAVVKTNFYKGVVIGVDYLHKLVTIQESCGKIHVRPQTEVKVLSYAKEDKLYV